MFSYDVMTEEEAMRERFQLLEDGEYNAVITRAEARISTNSGNPMIEVDLDVYDRNGRSHVVRDFLVFTRSMTWKVIHCTNAVGLQKEFESKQLTPEMLVNKNVRVLVSVQTGGLIPDDRLKGKSVGSKYPDKNVIQDYIGNVELTLIQKKEDEFNDELPF